MALVFPNAEARRSVRRLLVEVYEAPADVSRGCQGLVGLAAGGGSRRGVPKQSFLECEPDDNGQCPEGWFESNQLLEVLRGPAVVYVQAFSSVDPDAIPFLEGCNENFDGSSGSLSQRVPIALQVILPDDARMIRVSGVRALAGLPGQQFEGVLQVLIEANQPRISRRTYSIPGVMVEFGPTPGVSFGNGPGQLARVYSDLNGIAQVSVQLPMTSTTTMVQVTAPELRGGNTTTFAVSALSVPTFESVEEVVPGLGEPIDVAIGRFDGEAQPTLAVVSCVGGDGDASCLPGVANEGSPGITRMALLSELGGTLVSRDFETSNINGQPTLGILPAAVEFKQLFRDSPYQLFVLESRRLECQRRVCEDPETCPCWTQQSGTPCPCEGSVLRIFQKEEGRGIVSIPPLTLTASNAVAMASTRFFLTKTLVMAGQGRSKNERPCSLADVCLPYDSETCRSAPETCGCPPEERCETVVAGEAPVCVLRDRMVDFVNLGSDNQLRNRRGCQQRNVQCDKSTGEGTCSCLDEGTDWFCEDENPSADGCGCTVPHRLRVGPVNATSSPLDIVGGQFSPFSFVETLIVASFAGLDIYGTNQEWSERPFINAPIEQIVSVDLDPDVNPSDSDRYDDVAWVASSGCLRGVNQEERCPIIRKLSEPRGCLGVYLSDLKAGLLEISNREALCHRFDTEFQPSHICEGDFNGDGALDIAVTAADTAQVNIFLGNRWGALLHSPVRMSIHPDAQGGPMACEDINGDTRTDIAIAGSNGRVVLMRSRL